MIVECLTLTVMYTFRVLEDKSWTTYNLYTKKLDIFTLLLYILKYLTLFLKNAENYDIVEHMFSVLWKIVKLHSNFQTQLNFSWLEKELTLFSHGRRKKKEGTSWGWAVPSSGQALTCLALNRSLFSLIDQPAKMGYEFNFGAFTLLL